MWNSKNATEIALLVKNERFMGRLRKTEPLFEKLKHKFELQSPWMKKYSQLYQKELAQNTESQDIFVTRAIWPDSERQDKSARRDFKVIGILHRFLSEYRDILTYFANEYGERTLYTMFR